MSLSIIPLVILGQITEASINDDASLYQMTFKDANGVPLYGVKAVWTDEQAEIEALAAQKSYGVWINPINGTFAVKFAGYTYVGSADLTDPNVLAGITAIEFNNEAAGGGSGELTSCTVTIGSIVPTEGETPSFGAQVPLIILTEVGAEVKMLGFRPNQNNDGYNIYINQEKIDSPEITDVLVGQTIPYTFTTFDSVSAQGDIETVSGTFGSYIKINGNGTLNLVIHEGK